MSTPSSTPRSIPALQLSLKRVRQGLRTDVNTGSKGFSVFLVVGVKRERADGTRGEPAPSGEV